MQPQNATVIDQEGLVRLRACGNRPGTDGELEDAIKKCLKPAKA